MILKKSHRVWIRNNLFSYIAAVVVVAGFLFGGGLLIKEYIFYSREHKNFLKKHRVLPSLNIVREDLERLRMQSRELEQKINDSRLELKQMERQFAPLSPGTYEQNKLLVLDLATQCGLRITDENMRENKAGPPRRINQYIQMPKKVQASSGKTFLNHYPKGAVYKRPILKFKATATFAGVRLFFKKLQEFQWQVTPVKFSIIRKERKDEPALQSIQRNNSLTRTRARNKSAIAKKERKVPPGLQYIDRNNNSLIRTRIRSETYTFQKHFGNLELTVLLAL